MRELEVALARILGGKAPRGARLLNKNPHLWNKLGLVRAAFPDASLVVTSRDVRSTVVSTMRLWQWLYDNHGLQHYLPPDETSCWDVVRKDAVGSRDPNRLFPGGGPEVIAEYWLRCYERIDRDRHQFSAHHCVRLEEFAVDPPAVLEETASKLNLETSGFELVDSIDPKRVSRAGDDSIAAQERLDAYLTDVAGSINAIECAEVSIRD